MRRVRCVSPHGGAHYGVRADNELPAHEGYTGPLKLPPNEGGWVENNHLGFVRVGDEVDAPDAPEFIADGFHFVDLTTGQGDVCQSPADGCWCGGAHHQAAPEAASPPPPPPPPPAPEASGKLADLLRKGDS